MDGREIVKAVVVPGQARELRGQVSGAERRIPLGPLVGTLGAVMLVGEPVPRLVGRT